MLFTMIDTGSHSETLCFSLSTLLTPPPPQSLSWSSLLSAHLSSLIHIQLSSLTFCIRDLLKWVFGSKKRKTFSQIFIAQMTKIIPLNMAFMNLWKSNPKLHFQLTNSPLLVIYNLCTTCNLYCQTCFFITATPSSRSSFLSFLTDEIILCMKFLPPLLNIFCFL